jgi:hypothetical protein
MPHTIIGDTDSQCIFVRFEGKVTLDEILGVIDLLVADPAYRALHRRLHDYRGAEGTLSTPELKRLASHSRATRSTLNQVEQEQRRSAVLLGSDVNFGLGRMTKVFAESPTGNTVSDFRVFRTYAEAAEFLSLPSADYDPMARDAGDAPPKRTGE